MTCWMKSSAAKPSSRGASTLSKKRSAKRFALSAASGPVILADSQDNPGGGGSGDTTEILRELVEQGAQQALVGVINDAAAAAKAHQAGWASYYYQSWR